METLNSEYYSDSCFDEVMTFINEKFSSESGDVCWHQSRFEYARYLVRPLYEYRGRRDWQSGITLWRNSKGKLVGLVIAESADGNIFIIVRDEYKVEATNEMLDWALCRNYVVEEGSKKLTVWASKNDIYLRDRLSKRGFSLDYGEEFLLSMDLTLYDDGELYRDEFRLSSLANENLYVSRMMCVSSAFGDSSYEDLLYAYSVTRTAPNYDSSLDFCMVSDVSPEFVVAGCTAWKNSYDTSVYLEPCAVLPEYQGRGIGKNMLKSVLNTLKSRGVDKVYVGAYGDGLKNFYSSAGFVDYLSIRHYSIKIVNN